MIVVSDTSALCNLVVINHLWILETLYKNVMIPPVVAAELGAAIDPKISAVVDFKWIEVRNFSNLDLAENLEQNCGLDAGEAAAIALAIEVQATDLLMDERLGRQVALDLGLPVIGILGILMVAKAKNLIPVVRPVVDELIQRAGFRVSWSLYEQVLIAAGEN